MAAIRDTDDSSNTVAAHVPVTLADGLATALFTTPATQLRAHFPFECAILNANRTAAQSPNFPGGFFSGYSARRRSFFDIYHFA